MNKASGGDEIPVELFQILKNDAVKVLHSICMYIFEISCLSVASFAIIFSHSEGRLFTLLIVSFVVDR